MKKVSILIPCFLMVFSCFSLLVTNSSQAQTERMTTLTYTNWNNPPVKLVGLFSDGSEIKIEQKIPYNDGWLKNLTLKVKNVSNKTIVGIEYDLTVGVYRPNAVNPVGAGLQYGFLHDELNGQTTQSLAPLAEAEISLDTRDFNFFTTIIKQNLSAQSLPDMIRAHLSLQEVCFDDGSYWLGEKLYSGKEEQDTNNEKVESYHQTAIKLCGTVTSRGKTICCMSSGCKHIVNFINVRPPLPTEPQGYTTCESERLCYCAGSEICINQTMQKCDGIACL